jgi:hypothetical protein
MHAQASSAATSEAMHTDASALHPPLDGSLPSTQDSERLYERCPPQPYLGAMHILHGPNYWCSRMQCVCLFACYH